MRTRYATTKVYEVGDFQEDEQKYIKTYLIDHDFTHWLAKTGEVKSSGDKIYNQITESMFKDGVKEQEIVLILNID